MELLELPALLAICTEAEQTELKVLSNASTVNLKAVNSDPSAANIKNWAAVKDALIAERERLQAKYMPQEGAVSSDGVATEWRDFKDTKVKAEVLSQLEVMGYQLTQRTFYRHCSKGKCRKGEKGLYTRRLVKAYVESEGIIRAGASEDKGQGGNETSLALEKLRRENEKLEIHNTHARLKMEKDSGQLIEREGVYLEIAARLVTLDNSFRQKIETEAPTLITMVKGDMGRMPEFTAHLFLLWDEMLNSFATLDEFEVLFDADDIDGPADLGDE
jgi:hypothetical protein